jgi:homogentisate 1,2-dioxygenase
MIDTFKPLYLTTDALEFMDKNYPMSWTDNDPNVPFNEVNTP